MKAFRQYRFALAQGFALSIMMTAGFAAPATSAKALPQIPGQGSGGQEQQQSNSQKRPQQRSRPGKPSDRPTSQPGRPGRPSKPGKPSGQPTIQPVPGPRPNPSRPGYRPPSVRPLPPYQWRPDDRDRMRRYYRRNFGYINRGRRPIFVIGGYIPFGDRGYFTPVPPHLLGYLPPPPPGYAIGYFDGYMVVYDPISFRILSFVDLLD
jgi:hypothetical protein